MTPRNPLVALVLFLVFVLGLFVAFVVITTPFREPDDQAWFGLAAVIGIYIAGRFQSRSMITVLTVLSFIFVSRYLFWRMTETLEFQDWLSAFLGYGLFLAELYLWIALLVTYVQSAWPLGRKPVELPADMSQWPTVDILIPTFNEDLSIVSKTVLAAKALEYPVDKMRVYILDDGNRPEFRDFAREVGVGYITRDNNLFAKAGNLNNAMQHTNGELVAVFDCDHIPTRWFLQLTSGWFVREPRMAFIQTPHHFYNHDPFLRNLSAGDKVPPEGLLFYGLVQDGNDFWNASFFCGSCALLRRSAIEEVGGFAIETVTEDAETALKMHRRGWKSGFLRVPMAAGLATETLGRFIQQRIRWARGMVQILRIDNPLLGPGLTLAQRLCYLSAMMHFLFPLPRFVLLTAPLAFLVMDVRIITASAFEVFVNALPYLIIVIYVNWRIQGRYRHVFWSDVYETALTLHLLWPTVKTFLFPKGGKFNVTSKGGSTDETYFDTRLMLWHIILGLVLVAGIFYGAYGMFTGRYVVLDEAGNVLQSEIGTALLNLFWAVISLIYVGASIAVARELSHGADHRVSAQMPAAVRLADGRTVAGTTIDLSQGDVRLDVPQPDGVIGKTIHVEVDAANDRITLPADVVEWRGNTLTARFTPKSLDQQSDLVRLVFGRGDAWIDWDRTHVDATPLQSAGEIFGSIGSFLNWSGGRVGKLAAGSDSRGGAAGEGGAAGKRSPKGVLESAMKDAARQTNTILALIAAGLLSLAVTGDAVAQEGREPVILDRPQTEAAAEEPAADEESVVPGSDRGQGTPFFQPGQLSFPTSAPGEAPTLEEEAGLATDSERDALNALAVGNRAATTRLISLTLRDLGAEPSILLRNGSVRGIPFSVRSDEVVTEALVSLNLTFSPTLLSGRSTLVVLLNGEGVGTVDLDPSYGTTRTVNMPVDPFLLRTNNELLFEFIGEGASGNPECPTEIDPSVWVRVGHLSKVVLSASRFKVRDDLAMLPSPFFDKSDPTRLELPVVMPRNPSLDMLRASSIVASYWGRLADYRGASFPVFLNELPEDNAVVFARSNAAPAGVNLPPIGGPTIAVVDNPASPTSKLLLVLGRTDLELVHAAQALAIGPFALSGSAVPVSQPTLQPRDPYDAKAWLPSNRPVPFGEFVSAEQLEGRGLTPGVLTFNFRASPDIFLWGQDGIPVTVRYRYPSNRFIDHSASRLDVLINDTYIDSLPLERTATSDFADDVLLADFTQNQGTVYVPPFQILGQNRLQFFFDLQQVNRGGNCSDIIPTDIRSGIDVSSEIDMRGIYRLARMPNLAFMVQAGFPFTRMADLSETAFVMPNGYAEEDIEALLALSGLFGARSGESGFNVLVVGPDLASAASDRDLVVIGTFDNQPLLRRWSEDLPFRPDNGAIIVPAADEVRTNASPMSSWFRSSDEPDTVRLQSTSIKGLFSMRSPEAADRTVVAVMADNREDMREVLTAITTPDLAAQVQGDLVTVEGESVISRSVAQSYEIGNLPFMTRARWFVSDKPIGMIVLVLCAGLLLGFPIFTWLRSSAAEKTKQ